ncbi:bacteriocin [Staphylococcus xylosus]
MNYKNINENELKSILGGNAIKDFYHGLGYAAGKAYGKLKK